MGSMGTYGDLWGPRGAYRALLRPMGTYGGHMGTYGDLWGPMGTYGVVRDL